jgi:hypothetical protein
MSMAVSGHRFRRFNSSMPFATFRFSESGVWLGSKFPISVQRDLRSVSYDKYEIRQVFRAPGWFSPGVGLDTVDGRTHYFWTFRRRRILGELGEAGYTVGADRHPYGVFIETFPLFGKRGR